MIATANVVACCGVGIDMEFGDFELTPLGERRPRLPLQRKVKQLQRPWQSVIPEARVAPNRVRWASSQQRINCKDTSTTRPRSAAPTTTAIISRLGAGTGASNNRADLVSRRRPSTGPPQSRSRHGAKAINTRLNCNLPASSRQGLQPPAVRWDGTRVAAALTPRGHQAKKNGIIPSSVNNCRLGTGGPGDVETLAEKQSARRSFFDDACALQHSPLTTASFCASVATDATTDDRDTTANNHVHDLDATTDPERKGNNAWQQIAVESNTSTRINLAVTANPAAAGSNGPAFNTPGEFTGSRTAGVGGRRRPSSASRASVQDSSIPHLNITPRPQTVGAHNASQRPPVAPTPSEGSRDIAASAGGDTLTGQLIRGTESGEEGARSGAGSSIGGRVSVSVVLPVLEKENDARDARFPPGSTTNPQGAIADSAVSYSDKVGAGSGVEGMASKAAHLAPHHPSQARDHLAETFENQAKTGLAAANIANVTNNMRELGGDKERLANNGRSSDANLGAGRISAAVPRTRSPYIGALGYYVGEDSGSSRLFARTSLHGKALVGNHCYSAGSSKRAYTPAITPGEQPYGASHPLSPTSTGSPPRRHRNSNWGEEGMRLDKEEEENSRRTVPFIVSGTMLGWKLSTRGRKKSLEDSLKTSDYSEHHLIPVYGFRCNDEYGRGTGNGAGTDAEKRRVELRRLEARALAAERAALERRAKAEGGAGGAAFARAMSRRALARADLVQKMGDVLDVRKENVCRGSSPEVIRAYRKQVRDRVHGERNRRRTARGLPVRRPTRITAVTSRADLATSERLAPEVEHPGREERGGNKSSKAAAVALADNLTEEEELGIEPYLLFVRAKHRQEEETARSGHKGVVPFCAGCLGGCKGLCSPAAEGTAKHKG